jgi:hypothetical protein
MKMENRKGVVLEKKKKMRIGKVKKCGKMIMGFVCLTF